MTQVFFGAAGTSVYAKRKGSAKIKREKYKGAGKHQQPGIIRIFVCGFQGMTHGANAISNPKGYCYNMLWYNKQRLIFLVPDFNNRYGVLKKLNSRENMETTIEKLKPKHSYINVSIITARPQILKIHIVKISLIEQKRKTFSKTYI